MELEPLAVVGRQIFCLLVTLLRPIIRVAGGGLGIDPATGQRLMPAQEGEIVMTGGAEATRLTLKQTLVNPTAATIHASFALVLPRNTVVSGLALGAGRPVRGAGVGPRWAVREEFGAIRLAGGSSTLVSEDAPGIFSYEVAGLVPQKAVTTSFAAEFANDEGFKLSPGLRLRASFTVAPIQTAMTQPRRIMHLGTSRVLDAVIGIVERRRSVRSSPLPSGRLNSISPAAETDPQPDSDVFVTCERPGGASAAFRGTLADRPTRLVLDMQTLLPDCEMVRVDDTTLSLSELLAKYEGSHDEVRRQQLAREITELGLAHRRATLWTSLLAIAEAPQDPEGERVQAVA
ncbi:MAG: hypothetical protein HY270_03540 [Deltaproteobacteria bacterium]|nr:hypothetical protein [Deltaproteobacteria bacterium]